MAVVNRPTVEVIRQMLIYEPETGIFRWRVAPNFMIPAGSIAGSTSCRDGYVYIAIKGCHVGAHRLAYAYMTGQWPDHQVDHRDTNRRNNRWKNLRAATRQQNNANTRMLKNNTSGIKGVSWHKASGKWRATVTLNNKQICLGMYHSIKEAAEARRRKADELFGEFARHE